MSQKIQNKIKGHFVTCFYDKPGGGVGQYERSIYPHLRDMADINLATIQPHLVSPNLQKIGELFGRNIQSLLENHPYRVQISSNEGIVHLSCELLAPALLFYKGSSIVTVHHLPPIWNMEFQKEAGKELWFYLLSVLCLRKANYIIVDSKWTGEEVKNKLKISADHIHYVPLAVNDEIFHPVQPNKSLVNKYQLGNGPYILYVGGFEKRKNLQVLVDAYMIIREKIPEAVLVLVGPLHRLRDQEIEKTIKGSPGIHVLGYLPVEDLVGLYNLADVFIMPSKLEGFCLPILEAMACGCPVVASSAAAIPELLADAGILFNPNNYIELANLVIQVLSDYDLRKQLSHRGLQRSKKYTWMSSAEMTLQVYELIRA